MSYKEHQDNRRQRVLIAVIRRKKDLGILLNERWYRVPVAKLPRRRFNWIAFYQTSALGNEGKLIKYYARIKKRPKYLRRDLLPDEANHPKADAKYYKFHLSKIRALKYAVKNKTSMRVTFGFTTLPRLQKFRSIAGLFGVRPLERIFRKMLRKNDIPFVAEYPIKSRGRLRYRLDIAVFCKDGKIDIECDQQKYHSGNKQVYDSRRDKYLRRHGWQIVRLSDEDILFHAKESLAELKQMISELGGFC